jgi:hypothetical protein
MKLLILFMLLACPVFRASAAGREMSESQMELVYGGGISVNSDTPGVLDFSFDHIGGKNLLVDGSGNMRFGTDVANSGTLLLANNAQSNLRSVVNINAVNANIQVLLNIVVNVNAKVDNLSQSNIGGLFGGLQ